MPMYILMLKYIVQYAGVYTHAKVYSTVCRRVYFNMVCI